MSESPIPALSLQYPMDRAKGQKIPVQLRVNMWLGLSAHEKKFNSFSEGTFGVFAEMVALCSFYCNCYSAEKLCLDTDCYLLTSS